jgi:membrane protein DedA with SNARE-associated domain
VFEQLIMQFSDSGLVLWGPFLVLLLCGFGLPIPEDIVLVTAGFIGADNDKSLFITIVVMYLGIVIGDGVIYFAGRKIGPRLLRTKIGEWIIHPERLDGVRNYFSKYGVGVVFVGRFMPGLRTAIFFTAGTLRFSGYKFFAMDGLAALISAPVFVYLGHWANVNFSYDLHRIERTMGKTQMYLVGVAIVFSALIFLRLISRSRQSSVPPRDDV